MQIPISGSISHVTVYKGKIKQTEGSITVMFDVEEELQEELDDVLEAWRQRKKNYSLKFLSLLWIIHLLL